MGEGTVARGLSDAVFREFRVVQLVALPPGLTITVTGAAGVAPGTQQVLALALYDDGSVWYVITTGGSTPAVIK